MKICLDTNCVIYLIEPNPVWGPKVIARLAAAVAMGDTLAVSDLARAECLVAPLKNGDSILLADYQRFFGSPTIEMLPLSVSVCEKAASVRVASSMKFELPDCLHLAAAIVHGCGLFLTNDVKLVRCTEISVEVLS